MNKKIIAELAEELLNTPQEKYELFKILMLSTSAEKKHFLGFLNKMFILVEEKRPKMLEMQKRERERVVS